MLVWLWVFVICEYKLMNLCAVGVHSNRLILTRTPFPHFERSPWKRICNSNRNSSKGEGLNHPTQNWYEPLLFGESHIHEQTKRHTPLWPHNTNTHTPAQTHTYTHICSDTHIHTRLLTHSHTHTNHISPSLPTQYHHLAKHTLFDPIKQSLFNKSIYW